MNSFVTVVGLMAGGALAAAGQTTGVSHPDDVVVTTNANGVQQPVYTGQGPVVVAPVAKGMVSTPAGGEDTPSYVPTPVTSPKLRAGSERTAMATTIAAPGIAGDVDAGIVTSVPGRGDELAEGTLLRMKLREGLSTESTREGSAFTGELTQAVERDGRVLLPAGSLVTGRVTEVRSGKRISGGASIHLMPMSVTLPDGVRYGLRAQVIDTDRFRKIKVDAEGTMQRRDHPKETLAVLGLAAGGGAAAGGVIAGPVGAVVGAAVAGGVGTALWLKEDRQEEVPAGTEIVLSLLGPLVVGAQ